MDFNTLPYQNRTPALDSFYRASAPPGGGIGRFYEADHDNPAYWTQPEPDCVVGTDTSCRTGEATLVNLSPLPADKRNSKIDYIFFSETTAHATLSGDAIPMYLKDAAGTVFTDRETEAARDADGKYLKVSDHAFYRGTVTVSASPSRTLMSGQPQPRPDQRPVSHHVHGPSVGHPRPPGPSNYRARHAAVTAVRNDDHDTATLRNDRGRFVDDQSWGHRRRGHH
ncbi:hypothetical protein ACF061_27975 [Streptomyces sp. NPDC015220]|uniref:hypothetical protein n=1 Tax=Streptomyces sp. NPDC015220 TaxID=3364947 RepID=UPI0036F5A6CE